MGVMLSAAEIRDAQIYARGFEDGKRAGFRRATRLRIGELRGAAMSDDVRREEARIARILAVVAERFGVTVDDLKSRRRPTLLTIPRFLACHLADRLTRRSLPEIGRAIGGRDHTTILNALSGFERFARRDARWRREAEEIASEIERGEEP